MRRLFIFVLLAPPMGFAVTLAQTYLTMGQVPNLRVVAYGLPFAYVFGIVPGLLALLADWFFGRSFSLWPRVASTSLAGYVIGVVTGLVIFGRTAFTSGDILMFGLIGAIPAAVCSCLSVDKQN